MSLKKLLLLLISLVFSAVGCAGIGPNATYYMSTTSFNYSLNYTSYMVKLNNHEIGAGFGGGMNTSPVMVGPQTVTWKDARTGEVHTAKNQVIITKEQLKGIKYLAAHLNPDDTIEIVTSLNWPNPTEKGLRWQERIRKNGG